MAELLQIQYNTLSYCYLNCRISVFRNSPLIFENSNFQKCPPSQTFSCFSYRLVSLFPSGKRSRHCHAVPSASGSGDPQFSGWPYPAFCMDWMYSGSSLSFPTPRPFTTRLFWFPLPAIFSPKDASFFRTSLQKRGCTPFEFLLLILAVSHLRVL